MFFLKSDVDNQHFFVTLPKNRKKWKMAEGARMKGICTCV